MNAHRSLPRFFVNGPALRASAVLAALLCGPSLPIARADEERHLDSLEAVEAACRGASARPASTLYTLEIAAGFRFGTLDEEGFLPIDTQRNLRALGGRVEVFSSHLERVGFLATPARGAELEAARTRGARLRLGFFLGYDEPDRSACIVRSRFGVTTIRIDVAFVELLTAEGALVAREDTERLRAWRDDRDSQHLAGEGPRAALGEASTPSGSLPEPWQAQLARAAEGEVTRALGQCHRDGVARGAQGQGQVVVRLRVEGRTGRVLDAAATVSDLGDTDEGTCIAQALRALAVPAGPGDWAGRTVELNVPVRLAAD